jgi:hypothetical protein
MLENYQYNATMKQPMKAPPKSGATGNYEHIGGQGSDQLKVMCINPFGCDQKD